MSMMAELGLERLSPAERLQLIDEILDSLPSDLAAALATIRQNHRIMNPKAGKTAVEILRLGREGDMYGRPTEDQTGRNS